MDQNNLNTSEVAVEPVRKWLPVCLASFGGIIAIFCAVFAIIYADFGKTFVLVIHHPFLGGAGWMAGVCAVLAFGIGLACYLRSNVKILHLAGAIGLIVMAIITFVSAAFMTWGIFLVFAGLFYLAGALYLLNIHSLIVKLVKR